jgi:alanyl-tRNA synthetase
LHVGSDIEACAGTHCTFTGQVGPIKILKTERIQDGVERIEYAAGEAAVVAFQARDKLLRSSAETLRVSTEQLPSTIERFFTEWKEFKKENTRLKKELAESRVNHLIENAEHLKDIRFISSRVDGADADELTRMAGELASSDDIVALLLSDHEGVKIAAAAGDSAVSKGVNVGNIVRKIASLTGGGGGGKPSMARGGGQDSAKIDEGLALGRRMVEEQLRD